MKRTLLAIVAAFMMIASVNAQRLVDIQTEARFITDKMVVELGLSSVQRNSILNIPECSYGRPGWPGGTHVTYGPGKPDKHHKHHKHDKKWKHDRDWDDDDDDDDDD